MPHSVELSTEILKKLKIILECGNYDKISQRIEYKLQKDNIRIKDNEQLLFFFIQDKSLFRIFNETHGFASDDTNIFLEIINKKYKLVSSHWFNELFLLEKMDIKSKEFSNILMPLKEVLDSTIKMKSMFLDKRREILKGEKIYVEKLETLYQDLKQEGNIEDREIITIKEIFYLSKKVYESLVKPDINIYEPYIENLADFKKHYVLYLIKEPEIAKYIFEQKDRNKTTKTLDFKFFDELLMLPIKHLFSYISVFNVFKNICYMNDDRYYSYLEDCFKEIIGMANERKRMMDSKGLAENLSKKVEGYEEIERNKLGSLIFHHLSSFSFKSKLKEYLLLFFEKGFTIILKDKEKFKLLECIIYQKIYKSKIYEDHEDLYCKIVWNENTKREVIVVPFHNHELGRKVNSHINNRMKTTVDNIPKEQKEEISEQSPLVETIYCEYAAKLEFGDLKFLISFSKSQTLEQIKKRAICRVGAHFYPEKNIEHEMIDLKHYKDFFLYLRSNGNLFMLEVEEDLKSAIILSDGKLDIVIKHASKK